MRYNWQRRMNKTMPTGLPLFASDLNGLVSFVVMTRYLVFFFLPFLLVSCFTDHKVETKVVDIKGKPVNLTYVYQSAKGFLRWRFKGHVNGRVQMCINAGCAEVPDINRNGGCKLEVFEGDIVNSSSNNIEEYVNPGSLRCFVFFPDPGTTGEIIVEFEETEGVPQ
jgi:hypothetical protein